MAGRPSGWEAPLRQAGLGVMRWAAATHLATQAPPAEKVKFTGLTQNLQVDPEV
jgi:hypothetical protein